MYALYHMNNLVHVFAARDNAMEYVMRHTGGDTMGDYEILDWSDSWDANPFGE
jgi:hypothetical protein